MTAFEIINKKKRGGTLSEEEIEWVISGYLSGEVPDYQMSALLMAIYFKSMTESETAALTLAVTRSGETLDLGLNGFCVDKHSTGGVGDKTTLIVSPVVASCGVYVPKLSGRGLGHTGGTIDKLESIPGFRTKLDFGEFKRIIKEAGFAISEAGGNLVPADKKLYALRSAVAAVDSVPLICSSVMSKKLAAGADGIVLDVKAGDGAFMKNTEEASELAALMVRTARKAGKKCAAVITDMSKPLGKAVGNSLEVIEAIEALKGNSSEDLHEISVELSAQALCMAGKGSEEECRVMAKEAISSGRALKALEKMIEQQGGDPAITENYGLFKKAERTAGVYAAEDGYIDGISCEEAGIVSLLLGAGRKTKESGVDYTAGIVFDKTVGDKVKKGDRLAALYTSTDCDLNKIAGDASGLFNINEKLTKNTQKNIIKIIKEY